MPGQGREGKEKRGREREQKANGHQDQVRSALEHTHACRLTQTKTRVLLVSSPNVGRGRGWLEENRAKDINRYFMEKQRKGPKIIEEGT